MAHSIAVQRDLGTRRGLNLRSAQESMRARISFTQAFDRILAIEQQLLDLAKPQVVFDQAGDINVVPGNPEPSVVASLKVVLDSCWKKVNKQLPDLKPVDIVVALEEDQDVTAKLLSPVEMRRRVLHHLMEKAVQQEADEAAAKEAEDGPSFLY